MLTSHEFIKQPRVFATEWRERHQSTAKNMEDFGPVITMLPEDERVNIRELERTVRTMATRLDQFEFDPETDFLAIIGSPVAAAIAMCAIRRLHNGPPRRIQALIFDASSQRYRCQFIQTT